jgi:hypothetical protein
MKEDKSREDEERRKRVNRQIYIYVRITKLLREAW